MERYYRTHAVVNTDIVKENFIKMKSLVPETTKTLAVIKADAYGHGSVKVADALKDEADFFGVATVDEAVELRNAGIENRILILGYASHSEYDILIKNNITPVIYRYEDAKLLNDRAEVFGKKVKIHIAVDTGMGRIGFRNNREEIECALSILEFPYIEIEGAFSHFACADETDKSFTKRQVDLFEDFIDRINQRHKIEIIHIANSAGIVDFDEYRYNMVRAGISMYGYLPSSEVSKDKIKINPALEWHAHVTNIKTLYKGDTVSYGATCVIDKDTDVATVSVGYADGYPRKLSNKGSVIINNHYAKVLGRVCMDQIMVDITGIPDVTIENDVILLGKSNDCSITADDIAEECGTISYEILCDIGKRVPRVYA
ncbi:MAG: alanine racemase [Lachnospiraceae bacterium]|nr:alanine racemase [Lachnospiraceae bacterium]